MIDVGSLDVDDVKDGDEIRRLYDNPAIHFGFYHTFGVPGLEKKPVSNLQEQFKTATFYNSSILKSKI